MLLQRKPTIEKNWREQAEGAKQEALKLPLGKERNALMKKGRQLETASRINEWLSSPELKPPQ
jgi:hypothetical protein